MADLTYYIAVTLDGFIADPNGGFGVFPGEGDHFAALAGSFPETFPGHYRERLGIADEPNRRFDTVVMGRRTDEPALAAGLTSPYPHLDQYVVSRTLTRRWTSAVLQGLRAAHVHADRHRHVRQWRHLAALPPVGRPERQRRPGTQVNQDGSAS